METHILKEAVHFYTRKLIEANPNFIATPSALLRLNRQAEAIRQFQRRNETNSIWNYPVEVQADGTNPTKFVVVVKT